MSTVRTLCLGSNYLHLLPYHPVPESTKIGTTETLVHWTGMLTFQMERSTVVPLGRWPKAREGESGAPIVGFGGY